MKVILSSKQPKKFLIYRLLLSLSVFKGSHKASFTTFKLKFVWHSNKAKLKHLYDLDYIGYDFWQSRVLFDRWLPG